MTLIELINTDGKKASGRECPRVFFAMMKTKAEIVEVVYDPRLKQEEKEITRIVRSFYPTRGRIRVYRTADGRVGLQTQETLTPANRKQIEKASRAVMQYLKK